MVWWKDHWIPGEDTRCSPSTPTNGVGYFTTYSPWTSIFLLVPRKDGTKQTLRYLRILVFSDSKTYLPGMNPSCFASGSPIIGYIHRIAWISPLSTPIILIRN